MTTSNLALADPSTEPIPAAGATLDPSGPTEAIRGANPFVGLSLGQVVAALGRFAAGAARHPTVVASEVADLTAERLRILAGVGSTEIAKGDKRFSDPAWQHPVWQRLALLYLAGANSIDRMVDGVGLDHKSAQRAHFAGMQVSAALAPTNVLAGNPAALKRASAPGVARWSTAPAHGARRSPQRRHADPGRHPTVHGRRERAVTPGAVVSPHRALRADPVLADDADGAAPDRW